MIDSAAHDAAENAGRSTVVVLTPAGAGAIAVIRLSGPLNSTFAERHLIRPPRAMRCVHADIVDGGDVIDDAVVVQTAEGDLDLNVHAGPWVMQAMLNLATAFGYEVVGWADALATANAFVGATPASSVDAESRGAGDAGVAPTSISADDIGRQMLLDLPSAKSQEIVRLLLAQPAAWRQLLDRTDAAALDEALDRAIADTALETAIRVPSVALVGPANVGKSTLANALFGQARSITADVPGTTRDWVGELADLGRLVVRLIDTPGLRETRDAIEAAAIRRAGQVITAADLVVVVIDGSVPLDADALAMLARFPDAVAVRNKADRPRLADAPAGRTPFIDVAAITGTGLAELQRVIRARLGCADLMSPYARCWTAAQRKWAAAMRSR